MHFLSPLVHFWYISLTFFFVRFILIVVTWHYWYIAGNTATMLKYNEFDGEVSSGLACLAVDSHLYGWIKWFTQSVGVCVILLGRWSFFLHFRLITFSLAHVCPMGAWVCTYIYLDNMELECSASIWGKSVWDSLLFQEHSSSKDVTICRGNYTS